MINVLLVTTWGTACGIAEMAAYLKESVEAADPEIRLTPNADWLDPYKLLYATDWTQQALPLVHLNYHAALHSRWGVDQIAKIQALGAKVLVTYHDTGVPNSDQCKAIVKAADCAVVHEPFDDLEGNVHYIRQGVPDWSPALQYEQSRDSWCGFRPIVGTVGFPFPWKNYDLLCEASALAGWAVLLLAPGATEEQVQRWQRLNPHSLITTGFVDRREVGSTLAGCDATAFLDGCANTGTSGAIRQGIAARKPVLATHPAACRQNRDLFENPLGRDSIRWLTDLSVEGIAEVLSDTTIQRIDPRVVALAIQDSWEGVGKRYAALYRQMATSSGAL